MFQERDGRNYRRFGLVTVRGMPAVRNLQQLRLRHALGDAMDLPERAVFVVHPLHSKNRATDAGEFRLDVPFAKGRMQPDAVPAPEGGVDIVVIAAELLRQ